MSDHVTRINALTTNARNTWFALLAALVFVGVTLLSVKPIDFYGVGRATQLPLVGVSVPTELFFYAAPLLTVAIYAYFHLYLVRLWDALSEAPPRLEGKRLAEAVAPWLITDSALYLRRLFRRDYCSDPRSLEFPNVFWNILFAWAAGPGILLYLWIKSLPARDTAMSGIAAAMVIFSIIFCTASAVMLLLRMRRPPKDRPREVTLNTMFTTLIWIPAAAFIASETWNQTHPTGARPATLDLTGEAIVQRPEGWTPYALARTDFFAQWCRREDVPCKNISLTPETRSRFETEWKARRAIELTDLRKPGWSQTNATKPDFRGGVFWFAFLPGTNLRGADLTQASAEQANLEGVDLRDADVTEADFSEAQMEGASFVHVKGAWSRFAGAQLDDTDFSSAWLQHGSFVDASLRGATFTSATLTRAIFNRANMQRANLGSANLEAPSSFRRGSTARTLQGPT